MYELGSVFEQFSPVCNFMQSTVFNLCFPPWDLFFFSSIFASFDFVGLELCLQNTAHPDGRALYTFDTERVAGRR